MNAVSLLTVLSGFHSVALRPAASALPDNLLDVDTQAPPQTHGIRNCWGRTQESVGTSP